MACKARLREEVDPTGEMAVMAECAVDEQDRRAHGLLQCRNGSRQRVQPPADMMISSAPHHRNGGKIASGLRQRASGLSEQPRLSLHRATLFSPTLDWCH